MAFSQMLAIRSQSNELQQFLDKKPSHINTKKNKKLALNSGIQTYQILTNFDVCIISLSSILLAVYAFFFAKAQEGFYFVCIVFSVISRLYVTKKKPETGLCCQMVYATNCSIRGAGQVAVHDWKPSYLLLHLTMEPKSF